MMMQRMQSWTESMHTSCEETAHAQVVGANRSAGEARELQSSKSGVRSKRETDNRTGQAEAASKNDETLRVDERRSVKQNVSSSVARSKEVVKDPYADYEHVQIESSDEVTCLFEGPVP
eukprot:728461-Hanusia_phi.AAC.1